MDSGWCNLYSTTNGNFPCFVHYSGFLLWSLLSLCGVRRHLDRAKETSHASTCSDCSFRKVQVGGKSKVPPDAYCVKNKDGVGTGTMDKSHGYLV